MLKGGLQDRVSAALPGATVSITVRNSAQYQTSEVEVAIAYRVGSRLFRESTRFVGLLTAYDHTERVVTRMLGNLVREAFVSA